MARTLLGSRRPRPRRGLGQISRGLPGGLYGRTLSWPHRNSCVAIHTGTVGRFRRYRAELTTNSTGTLTPSFSAVALSYSLAGSNTSAQASYGIDPAGNVVAVTTITDAGVSTDVRTANNLNQITQRVVTPAGGGATTFTFTWNLDGTLASELLPLWRFRPVRPYRANP